MNPVWMYGTAALLLLLLVWFLIWKLPKVQTGRAGKFLEADKLPELENEFRRTAIQIAGGVVVVGGLLATFAELVDSRREFLDRLVQSRLELKEQKEQFAATHAATQAQLRLSREQTEAQLGLARQEAQQQREEFLSARRTTDRQLRLLEEGQLASRFGEAVSQLGAEDMAVRIGGIYSLEEIARRAEDVYGEVTLNLLASFVRNRARPDQNRSARREEIARMVDQDLLRESGAELLRYLPVRYLIEGAVEFPASLVSAVSELSRQGDNPVIQAFDAEENLTDTAFWPPQDVGAAMTVVGRRQWNKESRADLRGLSMRNADLTLIQFQGTDFGASDFSFAQVGHGAVAGGERRSASDWERLWSISGGELEERLEIRADPILGDGSPLFEIEYLHQGEHPVGLLVPEYWVEFTRENIQVLLLRAEGLPTSEDRPR